MSYSTLQREITSFGALPPKSVAALSSAASKSAESATACFPCRLFFPFISIALTLPPPPALFPLLPPVASSLSSLVPFPSRPFFGLFSGAAALSFSHLACRPFSFPSSSPVHAFLPLLLTRWLLSLLVPCLYSLRQYIQTIFSEYKDFV